MKNLELTHNQLLEIGFVCKRNLLGQRTHYEISTINGMFQYVLNQQTYVWYHVTVIGVNLNFLHLEISKLAELYTILQCFKVKFNLLLKF